MREISSKLKFKTPEKPQKRNSGAIIVNSEHISHISLVFSLLALNKEMPARKSVITPKGSKFRKVY